MGAITKVAVEGKESRSTIALYLCFESGATGPAIVPPGGDYGLEPPDDGVAEIENKAPSMAGRVT